MLIKSLIQKKYSRTTPYEGVDTVEEALIKDRFVVVMDENGYCGLLSLADTVKQPHKLVIDSLTEKPRVDYNASVRDTVSLMEKHSYLALPAFAGEDFFGVITYKALLTYMDEQQRQLEKKQYALEQFEALRMLASGVGHDFNNVLMRMFAILDTLLADPVMPKPCIQGLRDLEKGFDTSQKIIDQLMTYSQKGVLNRDKTDIATLIKETVSFFVSGKSVRTSFDFMDGVPPVKIDITKFTQIICNLTVNALQAMNDCGTITTTIRLISGEDVPDCLVDKRKYIQIDFSDSGKGIDEHDVPFIFNPYYTTKTEGTGLGLALVKAIVTDHEGHISVDSVKGRGTTFSLYLPCAQTGAEEADTQIQADKERPLNICVMEDDNLLQLFFRISLQKLGHNVDIVSNGEGLLKTADLNRKTEKKYDLYMLDLITSGDISAIDCIRKLSANQPWIKAIAMSGNSNDPVMVNYKKHGFISTLKKPFTLNELKQALVAITR